MAYRNIMVNMPDELVGKHMDGQVDTPKQLGRHLGATASVSPRHLGSTAC